MAAGSVMVPESVDPEIRSRGLAAKAGLRGVGFGSCGVVPPPQAADPKPGNYRRHDPSNP